MREVESVPLPAYSIAGTTEAQPRTLEYERSDIETKPTVVEKTITREEPMVNTTITRERITDTQPGERTIEYEKRVDANPIISTNRTVVTEHHVIQDQPVIDERRMSVEREVLKTDPVLIEHRVYDDQPLDTDRRIEHGRIVANAGTGGTSRVINVTRETKRDDDDNRRVTEHHIITDEPEHEWRVLDPEPVVTEHHIIQDNRDERRNETEWKVSGSEPVVTSSLDDRRIDADVRRTEYHVTDNRPIIDERRVIEERLSSENEPVRYERRVVDEQPVNIERRVVREEYVSDRGSYDRHIGRGVVYDEPPMVSDQKVVYNHHMHMKDGTRNSDLVIVAAPPSSKRYYRKIIKCS